MTPKIRTVSKIIYASEHAMGSIMIRQPLPSSAVEYLDPFVLLHHGNNKVNPEDKNEGVGPHPHRGFAPVSFLFKGGVHHRDSRGNNKAVLAGGTQWMNAGMGIIHSERPVPGATEMELIQMWINIPAKNKMDAPSYFPVSKDETPVHTSEDGKISLSVVSGNLFGLKGPVPSLSPVNSAMIHAGENGKIFIPLPPTHNAFIYLLEGQIKTGENNMAEGLHMVIYKNDGDGIAIETTKPIRALLMSGEPINEEIFAQGPFVMNSEIQIMEAYRDFKMGKMGVLIEE